MDSPGPMSMRGVVALGFVLMVVGPALSRAFAEGNLVDTTGAAVTEGGQAACEGTSILLAAAAEGGSGQPEESAEQAPPGEIQERAVPRAGEPLELPRPDLVPTILHCGRPLQLRITNQGTAPSRPSVTHVKIDKPNLNRKPNEPPRITLLNQDIATASLAPGQSVELSVGVPWSLFCLPPGPAPDPIPAQHKCTVGVTVDASHVMRELNDSNNSVASLCAIRMGAPF